MAFPGNAATCIGVARGGYQVSQVMASGFSSVFKVGIGPSSSHTVGPMVAAKRFVDGLSAGGKVPMTQRLTVELYGSLALTGLGHGSDKAVILGLLRHTPHGVDPDAIDGLLAAVQERAALAIDGHEATFDPRADLSFRSDVRLPYHSNGLRFQAWGADGEIVEERIYYSVGGGRVVSEADAGQNIAAPPAASPYPFHSAAELLDQCRRHGLSIADLVLANETASRPPAEVLADVDRIRAAMDACIDRGCRASGVLPGGLEVERRAPLLYAKLVERQERALRDPMSVLDWVNLWAMAVNEENAAGGRVVTAPTNGAAGIIPAVLRYYDRFCNATADGPRIFLLTATAIGLLYERNASISGAAVGCQGEVGVACSMAAAGLAAAQGGTNEQVENAAEIAMEHNLGLTCDPVGGLVQIPCIERNAMGAVKAIDAARLALLGDGRHKVSLDKVIETMRQTGADMSDKYKETSQGGLAVNVVEC